VTEVPVLAEDATQIAVAQKNGTRSAYSHQGAFFTEVGMTGSHFQTGTGLAKALLPFQSIHPAIPGAQITVLQSIPQNLCPLSKQTLPMQIQIAGFEGNSVHTKKSQTY
jgi:hypothetical protein